MKVGIILTLSASLFLPALGAPDQDPESLPTDGFIENETPFLRSALVFEVGKKINRTRRGVIIPLGHTFWACFDPDLLRWSAIWSTKPGQAPITYDSMAAISFPAAQAKATRPPEMVGTPILHTPETVGASTEREPTDDPRRTFLFGEKTPVGPLPDEVGQWLGISLRGRTPVLHYRVGETLVAETISAESNGEIQRILQIGPSRLGLSFLLGSSDFKTTARGARIDANILRVPPSRETREIFLYNSPSLPETAIRLPAVQPATPIFPKSTVIPNPPPVANGPFKIRNLPIPLGGRPIRPTDITFLSDGTGLLSTLDGDVWRIEGLDGEQSTWTRVATGIFEPMSITTTEDDRVFVLGRDQITELEDTNDDGHFDIYRCASDAFLQTLHSRDYATSLEVEKDGSFLIAKGGINKDGERKYEELSEHRGTILRISPDKNTASVLADGLRLPYVGLRSDGSVFASDQQGNYVPSTPIYRIGNGQPSFGFEPTDFRSKKQANPPLFYYPYQTNRSAATFATTSEKAFTDLAETFLQVSWDGRLFGISTPENGQAFSWQLPVQFDFPALNAATHPESGRLYVVGLGISGYKPTTTNLLGLASIEQSSPLPIPASIDVSENHIEILFRRPLAPDETVIPGNPSLRAFDVKRTPRYGSGHYKWDGKPGEHHLQPTSFSLSPDRTTLRMDFPFLRQSEVLDIQVMVSSGEITTPLHIFSRPSHLPKAKPADLKKLASLQEAEPALVAGDPAKGKILFIQNSCVGCHSLGDDKLTGPPLSGVASRLSEKEIRESILNPTAKITEGYPPSMPSFEGVISDQDLEHLVAFLMTLKK